MDKIYFRRFALPARIGVLAHEQQAPQAIVIDLAVNTDTKKAASGDTLCHALDYRKIKELITEVVNQRHYRLIETLAEEISHKLFANFDICYLQLSIEKPDIFPDMDAVGVSIVRER